MAETMPLPPVGPAKPAGRWGRWLRIGVRLLVAISVVLVARDLLGRFDAAQVYIDPWWFIVAFAPGVVAVLLQAFAWRRLMMQLAGGTVPLLEAVVVYLDGQMARYTPGKIGLLAVRVAAAPRLGVSPRLMLGSLLIEVLSWAGTGLLVGLSTLASTSLALPTGARVWGAAAGDLQAVALVLALLALIGLVGLCAIPRARFPDRLVVWLTSADGVSRPTEPLVPTDLPLWHSLHWLCWAVSGGVLVLGLGAPIEVAGFAGGVLCLAVVLSFLAVVVPAGAGVREVVISVLTAPVLGASAALVFGLTARAVTLGADVACWALSHLVRWRARQGADQR
jgi:glycosyltransferase 2 family protein